MKHRSLFLLSALVATVVGCNESAADETTAGGESTGGSDCIAINEGAGGEDCDATMCGPGEYCVGGGICEIGCRKTVTCAVGEYCDLSTADPISPGTCLLSQAHRLPRTRPGGLQAARLQDGMKVLKHGGARRLSRATRDIVKGRGAGR